MSQASSGGPSPSFTAGEVVAATSGRLVAGRSDALALGVSTDTRTLEAGQLFVALRGERFDGHDFLGQALRAGAAGLLVEGRGFELRGGLEGATGCPDLGAAFVVEVPDTLFALGELARFHRRCFPVPLVGVTGSAGKTSTRELVAAALEAGLGPVLATRGNLNNRVGLPLVLLGLDPRHRGAVLEMGTSEPGEIARLATIADPDVGVVTNVSEAHTEGLGGIEGVARAKGELFRTLRPGATAVVNLDDERVVAQHRLSGHRGPVVTFGRTAGAQVRLLRSEVLPAASGVRGVLEVLGRRHVATLRLLGVHNLMNAAAAVACSVAVGVDAAVAVEAMARVGPAGRRLAVLWGGERRPTVVDDCYNANAASMAAALEVLAALAVAPSGRRVAVLGDMLELGEETEAVHRRVGRIASVIPVDLLAAVGPASTRYLADEAARHGLGDRVRCYPDAMAAAAALPAELRPADVVLVKASRGMRLEAVVDALVAMEPERVRT